MSAILKAVDLGAAENARVLPSEAAALSAAHEVAATLTHGASARDRERRKPVAELDQLSSSGLLALTVPRELGGLGASTTTVVKVFQILAAADPAVAQLPQSHYVFANALIEDGTEDQRRFFLGEVLRGARLGNAQAERGSSSALDIKTRLMKAPSGGQVLSGTKHYTTGALFAHWLPVAAIDDEGRLVLVYVPRHAPGVEVRDDWTALGQRSTYSGTAHFRAVKVAPDQVVNHWQLFHRPSTFHAFAQLLHAAIDVGIAENVLVEAVQLLRRRGRPRLGAPVPRAQEDPLVLHALGRHFTAFHAAESLLESSARRLDLAGRNPTPNDAADVAVRVGEAKAFAEDVAVSVSSDVFALLGTSAADESLNLDRHWRNARVHTIHDANQWRFHAAGQWYVSGIEPGKPARRLLSELSP